MTLDALTFEEKAIVAAGLFMPAYDLARADTDNGEFNLASLIASARDILAIPQAFSTTLANFPEKSLVQRFLDDLQTESESQNRYGQQGYESPGDLAITAPLEERYRRIANILETKGSREEEWVFKRFIYRVGEEAAGRSGGGPLGLQGETSQPENNRLRLIAMALRLQESL